VVPTPLETFIRHALLLSLLSMPAPILIAQNLGARIDTLMREFDKPDVPGASVMVIRDGAVVFKKGYGLADLENRIPATTATNYRLASVTKQFTAMAILILKERGKLSFDDVLTDFFPGFPAYGKTIKIRHLLQHTSGLIAYEDVMPETTTVQVLDRDVLAMMMHQDSTYFPPGTSFRYSNTGYALLSLIVEGVSGMPFAKFLEKNIFRPLGMEATVAYEKGISTVPRRALGYTVRDTARGPGFERTDQSLTSAVLGDGGIYSSVEDLLKWDQALYTEKLVSANTLREAFTPYMLPDGTNTGYGFGWYIDEHRGLRRIHHGGSTVGFRTAILRIPEKKLCVILLANRASADPEAIALRIADIVLFEER
jgi:CubicO group peptidase (beta-lactamase class C family)